MNDQRNSSNLNSSLMKRAFNAVSTLITPSFLTKSQHSSQKPTASNPLPPPPPPPPIGISLVSPEPADSPPTSLTQIERLRNLTHSVDVPSTIPDGKIPRVIISPSNEANTSLQHPPKIIASLSAAASPAVVQRFAGGPVFVAHSSTPPNQLHSTMIDGSAKLDPGPRNQNRKRHNSREFQSLDISAIEDSARPPAKRVKFGSTTVAGLPTAAQPSYPATSLTSFDLTTISHSGHLLQLSRTLNKTAPSTGRTGRFPNRRRFSLPYPKQTSFSAVRYPTSKIRSGLADEPSVSKTTQPMLSNPVGNQWKEKADRSGLANSSLIESLAKFEQKKLAELPKELPKSLLSFSDENRRPSAKVYPPVEPLPFAPTRTTAVDSQLKSSEVKSAISAAPLPSSQAASSENGQINVDKQQQKQQPSLSLSSLSSAAAPAAATSFATIKRVHFMQPEQMSFEADEPAVFQFTKSTPARSIFVPTTTTAATSRQIGSGGRNNQPFGGVFPSLKQPEFKAAAQPVSNSCSTSTPSEYPLPATVKPKSSISSSSPVVSQSSLKTSDQNTSLLLPASNATTIAPTKSVSDAPKWTCGTCLVPNDAVRDTCVCCSAKKPQPAPAEVVGSSEKKVETGPKWTCGTCLVGNDATRDTCICCTAKKPQPAPSESSEKSTADVCSTNCWTKNDDFNKTYTACSAKHLAVSEDVIKFKWICSNCLTSNSGDSEVCCKCSTKRETADKPVVKAVASTTPSNVFSPPMNSSIIFGERKTEIVSPKNGTCDVFQQENDPLKTISAHCASGNAGGLFTASSQRQSNASSEKQVTFATEVKVTSQPSEPSQLLPLKPPSTAKDPLTTTTSSASPFSSSFTSAAPAAASTFSPASSPPTSFSIQTSPPLVAVPSTLTSANQPASSGFIFGSTPPSVSVTPIPSLFGNSAAAVAATSTAGPFGFSFQSASTTAQSDGIQSRAKLKRSAPADSAAPVFGTFSAAPVNPVQPTATFQFGSFPTANSSQSNPPTTGGFNFGDAPAAFTGFSSAAPPPLSSSLSSSSETPAGGGGMFQFGSSAPTGAEASPYARHPERKFSRAKRRLPPRS